MRADWGNIKLEVMKKGLQAKFDQNEALKQKLVETYPHAIVEHNADDKFWGDGHSDGLNWLGKILAEIRDSYIAQSK